MAKPKPLTPKQYAAAEEKLLTTRRKTRLLAKRMQEAYNQGDQEEVDRLQKLGEKLRRNKSALKEMLAQPPVEAPRQAEPAPIGARGMLNAPPPPVKSSLLQIDESPEDLAPNEQLPRSVPFPIMLRLLFSKEPSVSFRFIPDSAIALTYSLVFFVGMALAAYSFTSTEPDSFGVNAEGVVVRITTTDEHDGLYSTLKYEFEFQDGNQVYKGHCYDESTTKDLQSKKVGRRTREYSRIADPTPKYYAGDKVQVTFSRGDTKLSKIVGMRKDKSTPVPWWIIVFPLLALGAIIKNLYFGSRHISALKHGRRKLAKMVEAPEYRGKPGVFAYENDSGYPVRHKQDVEAGTFQMDGLLMVVDPKNEKNALVLDVMDPPIEIDNNGLLSSGLVVVPFLSLLLSVLAIPAFVVIYFLY